MWNQHIAASQACGEPGHVAHVAGDEIDLGVRKYSLGFFLRANQPAYFVSLIQQSLNDIAAEQAR